MLLKLFGPKLQYQKRAIVKKVWLEHLSDPEMYSCHFALVHFGEKSRSWWTQELDSYLIERSLKHYTGSSTVPFLWLSTVFGNTSMHHRREFLEYMKGKYHA